MIWKRNKGNKEAGSMARITANESTTGSTISSSSRNNGDPISRTSSAVLAGRVVFIFTLISLTASFGYLSYHLLSESESELTIAQFKSIADRALHCALDNTERKRLGVVSAASIIAGANPDPPQWPSSVSVTNFENIAMNIIDTSKGCYLGFAPLVRPSEVAEFEDHAYRYYEELRMPEPFPNGTGYSSFGKGIFSIDGSLNNTDKRYHDTVDESSAAWNSPNRILAPLFHHATGPNKKLMMNWHSSPLLGGMIDNMMVCAEEKAQAGESIETCSAITPILPNRTSWIQGAEPGPGGLMMQPVYPSNDPSKLTGVIVTALVWGEIMMGTYADQVCGINIVLSDGETSYTYNVVKGEAKLLGEGDLHLPKFDKYACEKEITPMNLFGNTSKTFTLTLYPTENLYEVYKTRNPAMASMGAVLLIAFTSVLFLLYDLFVRREFNAKKDLLSAKRKFVSFVSHEVRTPLNSVCMGLALLQDEMQSIAATSSSNGETTTTNPDKDVSKWLGLTDDVLISARSAVDVLNDFLNFDKIESGKLSLELSVIRIFELIEKTCDEFKLPAQKKKLNFSIKTPLTAEKDDQRKNECFVVGDCIRLTQVFRNLISNAIKFTPENGTIEVNASFVPFTEEQCASNKGGVFFLKTEEQLSVKQQGSLILSVSDSGAGMTGEQISEVFNQGTQFNANTLQGGNGSGLGTWIAKGIVRQHSGSLTAASEGLGSGSAFSVHLPVFDVPQEFIPARESKLSQTRREEDLGPLHILVVDDAKMNLKLLTKLLIKSGHTCDCAEDGLVAVDKVKTSMKEGKGSRQYDVILMDYQMPNMDGPTATKAIRNMGSDAFIVGVTGNVMAEDVRHFKLQGANHVLPKPIKIPDLEALFVEYDIRGDTFKESMPLVNFDMSERQSSKRSTVLGFSTTSRGSTTENATETADDMV